MRVTEMNDRGVPVTYKATRARRKSTQRVIPFTAGPQTLGQRIKRNLIG